MADAASVTVNVKTTADLTGFQQVQAEAKKLAPAQQELVDQLKAMGLEAKGFGDLSASNFKKASDAAKDAKEGTKGMAEGMDLFHINTSKALGETQVLIRELATGSFHARTLGSLMSALGVAITGAGIAAILLFEWFRNLEKSLTQLQENADAFNRELDRSIEKWQQMAKEAESIGDQVHLADAIHSQVQKSSDELDALIKKGKEFSIFGTLTDILGTGMLKDIADRTQKQDELNKKVQEGIKALNAAAIATTEFNTALERVYGGEGQAVIDEWTKKVQDAQTALTVARVQANIKPSPEAEAALSKALENYRFLVAQLKELQQGWDDTERAEQRANAELERMSGLINEIIKKNDEWMMKQIEKDAKAFTDKTALLQKLNDEAAINRATGNEEETIRAKINKTYDDTLRSVLAIKKANGDSYFTQTEAEAIANNQKESERQKLETIRGQETATSGLNVEMKEYETILQNIRQQQQVTGAQAFIGVDEKNLQLLRQYRSEIVNVINAMQQQQQRKATLTDPAEIARANQELQKFSAQYQLLAAKIVTTTHQFQAQLQSWANSFGSTGAQLANTLEQTVGTALQSLNQYIVTGKFNMQQLLQSVIMLGLQLVEQLLIQRAVALINSSLAETQAVASAQIIAAAWAGAATAVTTATEGQAAYSAPAAMAIGLAGVKGVLGIGSLHEGGPVADRRMHSGGLTHDEVPIIAQEGEIMIQRSVAQQPGMADFLLGLNAGMFHTGGFVAGRRYHRGSDDFDPSSWADPLPSGPIFVPSDVWGKDWGGGVNSGDPGREYGQKADLFLSSMWGGFGTTPSTGLPAFGPTMDATSWVNYPSVGLVPMAAPVGPDYGLMTGGHAISAYRHAAHSGGLISRMHSGGAVGKGGGGVHIYAFTDLKALTKHLGSKEGQKIIFDTVKGRRIDLGIT